MNSGLKRGSRPDFSTGLISRLKRGFRTGLSSVLSRGLKRSLISGIRGQLTTALSPKLKTGLRSRLKSQFSAPFRARVRRRFRPRVNSVLASGIPARIPRQAQKQGRALASSVLADPYLPTCLEISVGKTGFSRQIPNDLSPLRRTHRRSGRSDVTGGIRRRRQEAAISTTTLSLCPSLYFEGFQTNLPRRSMYPVLSSMRTWASPPRNPPAQSKRGVMTALPVASMYPHLSTGRWST